MNVRLFAFVFLALALTGAPFGMGRMMDTAHASVAIHEAYGAPHQNHGSPQPAHKSSTPHFMVCAACVAAVPQAIAPVEIAVLTGVLRSGFVPRLEGVLAAPDVPPPRD